MNETMGCICPIHTPIGELALYTNEISVSRLSFERSDFYSEPNDIVRWAIKEIEEFFEGKRDKFTVPISPTGSPFYMDVWRHMLNVPYGATATYGDIAKAAGRPNAYRAVGTACKRNPIALIIPCHRIIKASGDPCENYFGGSAAKEFLLNLEKSQKY